jgi:cbb3-type cytochrome oxidase subunit 3
MIEFLIKNAPTIATVGFFSAFCLILISVFRKKNKKKFDESARIPLDDE